MERQTPAPARFTLYSRSWCHLCEDMLVALAAFMEGAGLPYAVDVIDIDASGEPGLLARFDELVPVLFGAGPDAAELCHYFLDEPALRRHLGLAPAS